MYYGWRCTALWRPEKMRRNRHSQGHHRKCMQHGPMKAWFAAKQKKKNCAEKAFKKYVGSQILWRILQPFTIEDCTDNSIFSTQDMQCCWLFKNAKTSHILGWKYRIIQKICYTAVVQRVVNRSNPWHPAAELIFWVQGVRSRWPGRGDRKYNQMKLWLTSYELYVMIPVLCPGISRVPSHDYRFIMTVTIVTSWIT